MADRNTWNENFGSGLKGEYTLTVHMAQFTTDIGYNNGQTYVLLLTGTDENGEEASEMLAVGADWESLDGGKTITHPKGAKLNRNSTYAKWCEYAGAACEAAGSDWIFDKNPLDAAIWVDTIWHLKEQKIGEAYTNRSTQEQVAARFRLVPAEFLAFSADANPAPATASSPALNADLEARKAAALKSAANQATAPTGNDTKLQAFAQNDFETFIGLALADDAVTADSALVESILDSGPSGYYAMHHGK